MAEFAQNNLSTTIPSYLLAALEEYVAKENKSISDVIEKSLVKELSIPDWRSDLLHYAQQRLCDAGVSFLDSSCDIYEDDGLAPRDTYYQWVQISGLPDKFTLGIFITRSQYRVLLRHNTSSEKLRKTFKQFFDEHCSELKAHGMRRYEFGRYVAIGYEIIIKRCESFPDNASVVDDLLFLSDLFKSYPDA